MTALAIVARDQTCEVCESLDGLRLVGDVETRHLGTMRLCLDCAATAPEVEAEMEAAE